MLGTIIVVPLVWSRGADPGARQLWSAARDKLAALKDWEHGRRQQEGAAWAYLRVIEGEPAVIHRALQGRQSHGVALLPTD